MLKIGELRISCIICADGAMPAAWKTFEKDHPDLIFFQNNRPNVAKDENIPEYATPIVATNRCGFSYHFFQAGRTCIIANDGSYVAKANVQGEENLIFTMYS